MAPCVFVLRVGVRTYLAQCMPQSSKPLYLPLYCPLAAICDWLTDLLVQGTNGGMSLLGTVASVAAGAVMGAGAFCAHTKLI